MFRNNATPLPSPAVAVDVCTLLDEKHEARGLGWGLLRKLKGLAEAVNETAKRFKAQALPREPRRGRNHEAAAPSTVIGAKNTINSNSHCHSVIFYQPLLLNPATARRDCCTMAALRATFLPSGALPEKRQVSATHSALIFDVSQ